ncbi:fructose-specific phosphotransferase system IIA component [Pseudogracilibacillus auburnensis]|uniref:Fructose-specific phosphotransferase system IIA component n=1 Tax=Pseudogracilibacillus auburnensis TaxID=1494959 RepID=A0A2V3VJH5_9BACI|nr:fructose-specific phosphotransferase system IIA component [Pseudogracilibacillus auburnensis]
MKITELLAEDTIILDLEASTKSKAIDELVEKLFAAGKLVEKELFTQAIWEREKQGSTGIGEGVAIPHAKTNAVKVPSIVFGRSKRGIDFEALDQQPSHLFFMIAASEEANNEHLDTLARLSQLLMEIPFREQLMKATSSKEILSLIDEKETTRVEKEEQHVQEMESKFILAVTACPTGIAHTYMAADGIEGKSEGTRCTNESRNTWLKWSEKCINR